MNNKMKKNYTHKQEMLAAKIAHDIDGGVEPNVSIKDLKMAVLYYHDAFHCKRREHEKKRGYSTKINNIESARGSHGEIFGRIKEIYKMSDSEFMLMFGYFTPGEIRKIKSILKDILYF